MPPWRIRHRQKVKRAQLLISYQTTLPSSKCLRTYSLVGDGLRVGSPLLPRKRASGDGTHGIQEVAGESDVPQIDPAVLPAGRQEFAVGAQGDRVDTRGLGHGRAAPEAPVTTTRPGRVI